MHDKSVAELRAMVKSSRKDKIKAPSKMKKHELLAELGSAVEHEVQKVEVPVMKAAEKKIRALPKAVVPVEVAVKPIAKAETGLVPKAVVPPPKKMGKGKVTESVVAQVKQETSKMPVGRLMAGSQEARDYMAQLRTLRKAKKEMVE